MKEYTLTCFKDFLCKASECTDNCCIGWGIDIDKKTLDIYKKYDNAFKENIDFKNSSIRMQKNKRCPFLNENNLCRIIIDKGYDKLSYICKNHPKFFNLFDGFYEMGYGLCCEEAVRLLFLGDVLCETKKGKNPYFYLREKLFLIINDCSYTLEEKIAYYLDLICETDNFLFFNDEKKVFDFIDNFKPENLKIKKGALSSILNIVKKTEPIDDLWKEKINEISDKDVSSAYKTFENNKRYEKLFYYYTFRYLLKDIEEKSIITNGKLIVLLVMLNIIFDTYFKDNFNKNTVLISKQIEYSQYNLSLLENELDEREVFY